MFDRARTASYGLVNNPTQYEGRSQLRRGYDTFFVTDSVQARASTLRKVVQGDPWGDEPRFGAANQGLSRGYWSLTNAMHALGYIRAKDAGPNETIQTSKSTLLHALPWVGRAALNLVNISVGNRQPVYDKLKTVRHKQHEQLTESRAATIRQSATAAAEVGLVIGASRLEFVQSLGHAARVAWSLRSKQAARDLIIAHP